MRILTKIGFTQQEILTIKECVLAAKDGPFFDDVEFHTLFGIERESMESTLYEWPDVDIDDLNHKLAIHNSLGNLIGYPHGEEESWNNFISSTPSEVTELFYKWKQLIG